MDSRFKILKTNNKYYLSIPHFNTNDIVGIDPGVSTFLTCIDNNDIIIKIGTNVCQVLNKSIHKIMSIKSKAFGPAKKTKILDKYETRVNNKIHELHIKSVNFLISKYKAVLIGDFGSDCQQQIIYPDNDIRKYLRYDLFIQLLTKKCGMYRIDLRVVDETLTSKLCSQCGSYNKFGTNYKVYKCVTCGFVSHRDVNASLNILNKNNDLILY